MTEVEIAARIGDITLQLLTVSDIFHDMIKLYHQVGISF